MSTKLLSYPKISDIKFREEDLELKISKQEIEAMADSELERIAKQHGKVEEATSDHGVSDGDIVMMRTKSENSKYNKPMIPVTVGKGIYNADIEENIIGMKQNESKDIALDGFTVNVTILKIKTKTVPQLTLEMVNNEMKSQGDEFSSIDEFRASLIEDAIEMYKFDSYYGKISSYVRDFIVEKSEYEIDEKEAEEYRNKIISAIEKEASDEKMELKEYMATLFASESDVENIEERVDYNIRNDYLFSVYAKELGKENNISVSEADYEKFVRECIAEGNGTEEEIKSQMPFEIYESQCIDGNVQNMIIEKYFNELKVELV